MEGSCKHAKINTFLRPHILSPTGIYIGAVKKVEELSKEGACVPRLKSIVYKLQTALCQQGRYIKINQHQSYSERQGRMVTKYVLQETMELPNGKRKSETILETYQLADVVKKLAAIYNGGEAD